MAKYAISHSHIYTGKLHFDVEIRDGEEWVVIGRPYDGDRGPDGINTLVVPVNAVRQFLIQHDLKRGR